MTADNILKAVENYYSAKAQRWGATAPGVDWNSPMSQRLRFVQLLKVVDWSVPSLVLHDLGCGYGALLEHLAERHSETSLHYIGSDISDTMIGLARRRWKKATHAQFALTGDNFPEVDYTVASGIFNVCLGRPQGQWERYVADTLVSVQRASRRGFSVNFMAPEVLLTRPEARGQLYVTEQTKWSEYCKESLGCDVQVLKNYGLPEFTILALSSGT